MEGCCLRCCLWHRQSWRMCVALAIGVAVVVLVTALPSLQKPPGGSEGLEQLGTAQRELQAQVAALGQALAVTNRSLAEALAVTYRSLTEMRGQWESCRNELDALKSTVSELRQHLAQLQHHRDEQEASVVQLQEDNRELKERLERQQHQLKEAQTSRSNLQSQIWNALSEIQSIRSWHSSGTSVTFPGVAVPLVLLALLFAGTLLL
ncbi:uncharacterized protein LOC121060220 isoform X2 [Cygnus olor]|uniref:uncharacterized protein LOC121060220 isoform X2 n=1 Tax=Cygnus olor TaxID=8869 RepID=UPI001ADEA045|nr:uncharacterized protein LOC121060220 isoform X2 [Cygnus olor]